MPHDLRTTQERFARSILMGTDDAADLIAPGALTVGRRIEIYRHNVLANLRGALRDIFPAVLSIVGDDFFSYASDQFIAACPSRSGDLSTFGRDWPAFLAEYEHAQTLPHLPDVARLEWMWHEAFHAADHEPLNLARLAAVPAERHGALRFQLHPAVRLLRSPYPLLRLWTTNQPGYEGDMHVDWASPEEFLVVSREGVQVLIRSVDRAVWLFLEGLAAGLTLDAATDAALAADDQFDLQGLLIESVQSTVIVNFSTE
jgi:hypothetical protein